MANDETYRRVAARIGELREQLDALQRKYESYDAEQKRHYGALNFARRESLKTKIETLRSVIS